MSRKSTDRNLRPKHYERMRHEKMLRELKTNEYPADRGPVFDHSLFAEALNRSMDKHQFIDVRRLRRLGRKPLNAYIKRFESVDPAQYTEREWETLLINLFNAQVLNTIANAPKNANIPDVRDTAIWVDNRFRIGGISTSFSDIHSTLVEAVEQDTLKLTLIYGERSLSQLYREPFIGARFPKQLDDHSARQRTLQSDAQSNRHESFRYWAQNENLKVR